MSNKHETKDYLAPSKILDTELSAKLKNILHRMANQERDELVEALIEAHRQVDVLMATVLTHDKSFMPSKSALWPEVVRRADLIRKHGGML